MKKLLFFLSLFLIFGAEFAFGQSQNYLINGGFDLWQRGSTNARVDVGGAWGYLADRWFATAGTYDKNTSNLPTGHKAGAQLAFSSSSGWLCQRIESENTRFLTGQKMTLSGYERSSAGTGPLKLKIDRPNTIDDYGGKGKTGTTTTSELAATTLLSSTSTTLTPFRYIITVSVNMASYGFQVCLGTDASTTTTYQLSAIMLNEGIKKLPFRRMANDIGGEILLAQRYFEKMMDLNYDVVAGSGQYLEWNPQGSDAAPIQAYHSYKVVKRGGLVANINYYSCATGSCAAYTSGNFCYHLNGLGDNCNGSLLRPSSSGFIVSFPSSSGYGIQRIHSWQVDAEL